MTDFGARDPYVGIMKGVILSICPRAAIVDLTHEVAAHEPAGAAFALRQALPYFPAGTIFAAVVDPGVGSGREILAVRAHAHTFLAPDNGLLDFLAPAARAVHRVARRALFLRPLSRTFHGRDVFAPVAARLAGGLALAKVGPRLPALPVRGRPPRLERRPGRIVGEVLTIDRFGNLVTNIPEAWLPRAARIRAGRCGGIRLVACYADGAPGRPVGLVGSAGTLEIAVARGRADRLVGARAGDPVEVRA